MKFFNLIFAFWLIVGIGLLIYGFVLEPSLRYWPIAKIAGAFFTFSGVFNLVYSFIVNRRK